MIQDSEFRVQILWFRVQSSGFRVQSSEFRAQSSEFRVQSSGFRVQRFRANGSCSLSGLRAEGLGFTRCKAKGRWCKSQDLPNVSVAGSGWKVHCTRYNLLGIAYWSLPVHEISKVPARHLTATPPAHVTHIVLTYKKFMVIVRKHDNIFQKTSKFCTKTSRKTDDNMHLLLRHMPHKESD